MGIRREKIAYNDKKLNLKEQGEKVHTKTVSYSVL